MIAFDTVTEGDVSPGLLGFLVVAALGFALFLLIRSMRKQISKIEVPSEAEARKAEALKTEARTAEAHKAETRETDGDGGAD
ncbi:hypothetical protein HS041_00345 [Planomonospora sp. ID67723]|uniref:hypothetical protein n=1 Tax=Planomonospora sp. ID67723 TaxID=2738134 RepID=UPI0018C36DFB|nr:hypothetical protein [Planomonospora sp. ID67723]MBG0826235.1 hypothetical protein [Planomonospora sp. ID67723]